MCIAYTAPAPYTITKNANKKKMRNDWWLPVCAIAGLTFDYINAFQLLNSVESRAYICSERNRECVCLCVTVWLL